MAAIESPEGVKETCGSPAFPSGRLSRILGLCGGLVAALPVAAADIPPDRAELMYHVYDGGGVKATGPAILVRKSLSTRVSASASYYVDAVTNASIDVVTTASKFKENRNEYGLGVDWVVRDAVITAALSRSDEPDYKATSVGLDVSQEVFGGMTTFTLGFSRGSDDVLDSNDATFRDEALHWQYRLGVTQILSPRWLVSMNAELVADEGFLGSPYRAARVFGATVEERMPRTRSSRAIEARTQVAIGEMSSARGKLRYFWDSWGLKATTFELGGARRWGGPEGGWVFDGALRVHNQNSASFYSDNASVETTYITRNRQLSAYRSTGLIAKATKNLVSRWGNADWQFTGAYEFRRFDYSDFTDLRTGGNYAYDAHVFQIHLSANY